MERVACYRRSFPSPFLQGLKGREVDRVLDLLRREIVTQELADLLKDRRGVGSGILEADQEMILGAFQHLLLTVHVVDDMPDPAAFVVDEIHQVHLMDVRRQSFFASLAGLMRFCEWK